jgi:hypothetical protein
MVGCIKQSIVTILLPIRNGRGDERATAGDISRAHGCEWSLRAASGILDSDAEIRWVSTAGVGALNCILFDNAFCIPSSTLLLRTEFDGVTAVVANYSGIGVTGFHHNIDPGRKGMIPRRRYRRPD